VQEIVQTYGKQMIGWEEIAQVELLNTSIVQHWQNPAHAQNAMQQRAPVIMSPASRVYFDMKYDRDTELGLNWAGYVDTQTSYSWDPATQVNLLSEANIIGVEAPLWTETVETMADIETLVFPRLPGLAESGWSPQARRDWFTYRQRPARTKRGRAMDVHLPATQVLGKTHLLRDPPYPEESERGGLAVQKGGSIRRYKL
jgi:hexosaminidase